MRGNTTQPDAGVSSAFRSSYHCNDSTHAVFTSLAFVIIHILCILPLSSFVFYLSLQRWQQQRSFATTSHSDIFTYHSAVIQLIYVLGCFLNISGIGLAVHWLEKVGLFASTNLFSGQISFHILTCVERYLAVVHPVIYRGLRHSWGVRIRNISIGCVWLLYFGWLGFTVLYYPNLPDVPMYSFLAFSLIVVSFCSISVLNVLIHPGPGKLHTNREGADKMKQRAFHTIATITAVLWLYVIGLLVTLALERSRLLSYNDGCVVLVCGYFVTLPSNLVLPLLFLHRAGKLVWCHSRSE